jgi:hypothetical protein
MAETRATDQEAIDREAEALAMLANGAGTAYAAQQLATAHGLSLRQARRYVRLAALELCEPATALELDTQAMVGLHRLELIAGRAMESGDDGTAIRATRAHSASLTQFRKAVEGGKPRRIHLRGRSNPVPPDEQQPDDTTLPF